MITDIEKQSKDLAEAIILLPEIGGDRCFWTAYLLGPHFHFRRAIGSKTDLETLQQRVSAFNAASGICGVHLNPTYSDDGSKIIMFELMIEESVFDDFYQSLL